MQSISVFLDSKSLLTSDQQMLMLAELKGRVTCFLHCFCSLGKI